MLSISKLQQLLHTGHQNDYFDALYTYYTPVQSRFALKSRRAGGDIVKEKSIFRLMQAGGG